MMERSNDFVSWGVDGFDESDWTKIVEDFERGDIESSCSCESEDSSIVSDASSPAQWTPFLQPKPSKRLDFKKTNNLSLQKRRKIMNTIFGEDPSEDTASSPLNSPQASGITLDRNSCNKENQGIPEADNSSSDRFPLRPPDRNESLHFTPRNECASLKKMGLCLVPISILKDYRR